MHETPDPRIGKIDEFVATIRAYAEKLGIEFEISDDVHVGILRQAQERPLEDVLRDALVSLKQRFDAVAEGCPRFEGEDDLWDIEYIDDSEGDAPTLQ